MAPGREELAVRARGARAGGARRAGAWREGGKSSPCRSVAPKWDEPAGSMDGVWPKACVAHDGSESLVRLFAPFVTQNLCRPRCQRLLDSFVFTACVLKLLSRTMAANRRFACLQCLWLKACVAHNGGECY